MARRRKRNVASEAVAPGGSLRAKLRKRTELANRDRARTRVKQTVTRTLQGAEGKLCVFLDDEFFLLGVDELNLTLWRARKGAAPKFQGYFPRLSHALHGYLEKCVTTATATKTDDLITVVRRVEAAIQALDGKELVPVPVTD